MSVHALDQVNMPPATGLQFYRKRQPISQLQLERPKSLQSFREAVACELTSIEKRSELLQHSYYGPDQDIDAEIQRWLPTINAVLKQQRISYFFGKRQLQDTFDLLEKAKGDPTMVVDMDKEAVQTVLDCTGRVLQYMKTGFADILKDMRSILEYMTKYCLSFSASVGDKYLDTAVNYERQRQEFIRAIKVNLDDVNTMTENFEYKTIKMTDLGSFAREIAEKNECMHTPFLLIIPQAFENIKNAVIDIQKWLKADEGYVDFLQFDIKDLEVKKEEYAKKHRDLQVRCSNCDHKVKTLKRELGDIEEDVNRFKNREISLLKEKEEVIEQNRDVLFDLDIKEFRKNELKHHVDELNHHEKEKYQQLLLEIAELTEKRPSIDRKMEDITKKLELISERKQAKIRKEKEIVSAKSEVRVTKKEFRKTEVELERLEANLTRLKEICRYKNSDEVLKKVFHKMPLTAKHVVVTKGKNHLDKLEKSIRLTAAHIDGDWAKLYRNLPFYPPRGEQTLAGDINEIWREYMRHNTEEIAKQSLWRWRRMHNRASIDDLKVALVKVKRKDIAEMIEKEMARRAQRPSFPSPTFRTVRFPKLVVKA